MDEPPRGTPAIHGVRLRKGLQRLPHLPVQIGAPTQDRIQRARRSSTMQLTLGPAIQAIHSVHPDQPSLYPHQY